MRLRWRTPGGLRACDLLCGHAEFVMIRNFMLSGMDAPTYMYTGNTLQSEPHQRGEWKKKQKYPTDEITKSNESN